MRFVPKVIAILAIALGTAGCGSAAATPSPVPTVAPTPVPSTDGAGPEYVTGRMETYVSNTGSQTVAGTVTQVRNMVTSGTATTNDPRVTGTLSSQLNIDVYTSVGAQWGTVRFENGGGAWEGEITGAGWNDGNSGSMAGWLIGSGNYSGYTFYVRLGNDGLSDTVEGIIFPGMPPNS